jgi:hypothetical protein
VSLAKIELQNNGSTLAKNDFSLEYKICGAENGRSENIESKQV